MEPSAKKLAKLSFHHATHRRGFSLFGVRAMHGFLSYYVMEAVLQFCSPARIVEFGTWSGGVSLYLHFWAKFNGAKLLTIDVKDLLDKRVKKEFASQTHTTFVEANVFTSACFDMVSKFISGNRCLIYCDNGNKEKELLTYCKLLKPGSVIGCHDFGDEVHPKSIGRLYQNDFQPLLLDKQIKELDPMQQFWLKK